MGHLEMEADVALLAGVDGATGQAHEGEIVDGAAELPGHGGAQGALVVVVVEAEGQLDLFGDGGHGCSGSVDAHR